MKKEEAKELERTAPVLTLAMWLWEWVTSFCINVRQSTRAAYEANIRRIESSKLASIQLHELTTQALQDYIIFLLKHGRLDGKGGLSPKSIRNLFGMLHEALKQAVGCKLIDCNPADFVQLPKVKEKVFANCLVDWNGDILLFQDRAADTAYKKQLGSINVQNLQRLQEEKTDDAPLPFVVIFTERLGQEVDTHCSFIVDTHTLSTPLPDEEVVKALYNFDRKVVARTCTELTTTPYVGI